MIPLNPIDVVMGRSSLPTITRLSDLQARTIQKPEELIEGVLHRGCKMVIGGGSKGRKTWSFIDLAVCVATGRPWWGFPTRQAPVLYVNFELQEYFAKELFQTILTHYGLDEAEILIWNLRGHAADLDQLIDELQKDMAQHDIGLAIFDPIYKLLGDKDENAAGDMAHLMNQMERIALRQRCAIVFGHHYRKGGPGEGKTMDRMSGSGVFSRDPDAIITMSDLEEPDCVVVEPILRNVPPVESFGLRWDFPTFNEANDLELGRVKGAAGAKPSHSPEAICPLIDGAGELSHKDLLAKVMEGLGIRETAGKKLITRALDTSWIDKSKITGHYSNSRKWISQG